MKYLRTIISSASLLALASCASMQNASVADYNGDGLVSDAEYKQYQKQKNVEDRNVYTESNKRRNAVRTVTDTRDALWGARSIRNTLRGW